MQTGPFNSPEANELHYIWLKSGIWRRFSFEDFIKKSYEIARKYEKRS